MKQWAFVVLLLLSVSALIVPILLDAQPPLTVAGRIRIPAADIRAEVMTASHGSACGCCGVLWNGGIASTPADLSAVQVDDTAELLLLDGSRMVLECVEIAPCIRLGRWLIGWRGMIPINGDVLLLDRNTMYRFVRL